jgi:perosamine synthetase
MAQASPIIVDIRRDTYCIDPEQIERAITSKTKAIIPVHLYGHPAAMISIREIAEKYGLKIIEDAAEAHGAEISGAKVGSFGDCAVFSFYGNKIITTGEGGMITTNDEKLSKKLRFLRDHAMSESKRYWHTEIGFNYRMTNLQAAIGVAQVERIDEFIKERSKQLLLYRKILETNGLECNPSVGVNSVNWLTCVVIKGIGRYKRDKVIEMLRDTGVDTRPFFYPISMFPMYKTSRLNPIAAELSSNGINLPTFIGLKNSDIELISEVLLKTIKKVF